MNIDEIVQFALLGLGTGAIYALLGQGIVVIYRGSGVVNFAQGALAMIGAYAFWELQAEREWPLAAALVIAVAVVAVLGIGTHLLIMRPLRHSSALSRLIATLALLSILTAAATLIWGTEQQLVEAFLPREPWEIDRLGLSVTVPSDRIYLFVIASVLTVLLSLVYRRTRFGRSVTAVAEDERIASMVGISPDWIAAANWAVGGALAALAGILVVPITGLQVNLLTFLVIPALAAALAGGFTSFGGVLAAGLMIGVLQGELARYGADLFGATGQQGIAASLPFAVIVVVLVVRGSALPLRSHVFERLPSVGTGHLPVVPVTVASVAVLAGAFTFFSADLVDALLAVVLAAMIILSIVLLTGYAGQVSLAQFALGGMGAFVAGRLVATRGWPFELALPAGILGASAIGLVFAVPALRTRGINLAVVTLGLGLALQQILFANTAYTGGINGTPVGETEIFGLSIDGTRFPERYLAFCLLCLVLALVVVSNVRRSRMGRRMIAVRTNERAAASLGISVFGTKLYAFTVSAGLAGFAGILYAFQNRSIVYSSFGPFESINALLEAVIGGVGHLLGPLLGAQFAPGAPASLVLERSFDDSGQWLILAGGVGVLIVLARFPDGLAGRRRHRPGSPAATRPRDARTSSPAQKVRSAGLEVRNLHVRIRAVEVLRGIDVVVPPASVVGLVGPNGAGKTVCLDAIAGFVKPSGGDVRLGGVVVTGWSPARRAAAGMGRSFQSLELFDDATVEDNIRTASESGGGASIRDIVWPRSGPMTPAAVAAIDVFGLGPDLACRPDELSFGRRRLVAVARAVATEPSLLLLDEPAAGLSTPETAELSELVRLLADEWGIGVLLVEHDMSMVLAVCDRVVVLDGGVVIADGPPAEVRLDPRVIGAYLGGTRAGIEVEPRPADVAASSVVLQGSRDKER